MKISTSFAVLALLASAGSALAAPLPLPVHGNDNALDHALQGEKGMTKSMGMKTTIDLNLNKPQKADQAEVKTQGYDIHADGKKIARALVQTEKKTAHGQAAVVKVSVDAQDKPKAKSQSNGNGNHATPLDVVKSDSKVLTSGVGKGNGKTDAIGANKVLAAVATTPKILSSTASNLQSAGKSLSGAGSSASKNLSNPKAGEIGHLGKTADDALQPDVNQAGKALPGGKGVLGRDLVGSVTETITKQGDGNPIQTASTSINKDVKMVNNASGSGAGVGKSDPLKVVSANGATSGVGGVVKPVITGGVALPKATSGVVSGNGLGSVVGSTEKLLLSTTGPIANPVVNDVGKGKLVDPQSLTKTAGSIPANLSKTLNIDPLSNSVVGINSDGTESDVRTKTNGTSAHVQEDHDGRKGTKSSTKQINNSAFSTNGTNHRANPHPADPVVATSTQIVKDVNRNSGNTIVSNTGNGNPVGVKTDSQRLISSSPGQAEKGTNSALNSTTRPADPVADAVIPSNSGGHKGSLLTVTSQDANAKLIQTPGKSDTVADTNSNDATGSRDKNGNINIKVATPQQVTHTNPGGPLGTDTNIIGGGRNGLIVGKDGQVGPSDQRGNTAQSAKNGKLLLDIAAQASAHATETAHPSAHTSHAHTTSTHRSVEHSQSATGSHSSTPAASQASKPPAASSAGSTATPIAQVAAHDGSVQVNKNSSPTSLPLSAASSIVSPLVSASVAGSASPLVSSASKVIAKSRQATITYGQKGEHIVACDGKKHQQNDRVDECISADLLDSRPSHTEACPADMQHNINYSTNSSELGQSDAAKEIQKYVRLCLTANSL